MFAEAAEAADVVARQHDSLADKLTSIGRFLAETHPSLVVTCARGSSDHAATFAKYLIETQLDTPVLSHAPSITSLYHMPVRRLNGALFVPISQSGQSPDLILSAKAAKHAGAHILALVNHVTSPLSECADDVLDLCAGPERSVAATKSYIASLALVARLVAAWGQDNTLQNALNQMPEMFRRSWEQDWSHALDILAPARNLFTIGRGLTLGIAQEAALKFKETCGLHAEAFSAAEVRHGPMAIVERGMPILMFVPEGETREGFEDLAALFTSHGAHVLVVGGSMEGAVSLPTVSGLHPALAPMAMIHSFYRMVASLAVARGRDPDQPPHLKKVTETR